MRDHPIIERTLQVNSKGWPYWNSKKVAKALGASEHNQIQAEARLLAMKSIAYGWEHSVFERTSSISFVRWALVVFVMALFPENDDIINIQMHLACQTDFDYAQALFDRKRGIKPWGEEDDEDNNLQPTNGKDGTENTAYRTAS